MKPARPGGSPIVRIGGVQYFLDMRLKQLRAVDDPRDCVELDDELVGIDDG